MSREQAVNAQGRISYVLLSTLNGEAVSGNDAARFWAKVQKTPTCWLWTASKSGGKGSGWYGQFTINGGGRQRHIGAHVLSYNWAHGPVPDGMEVMHSCDVPHCVNPDHLFAGTHRQNVQDAASKGRLNVPRPTAQKVTDAQIAEMRALRHAGLRLVAIADRFNVSKSYVSFVVRGLRRQVAA